MVTRDHTETHRAAEKVARESYGQLVACLAANMWDVAQAEDALADAFAAALRHWPASGVPDNPAAWLLTAARRNLVDSARRKKVQAGALEALRQAAEATQQRVREVSEIPDERLQLLFLCAHPALDPALHTPLMLQTVLGIDAATIASAFCIAPATMSQRLVRAKKKIAETRMRFELPDRAEWPARLDAVLAAIYAAYGTAWNEVSGADLSHQSLSEEAIWLSKTLAELVPAEPEAHGLRALILYCEARRAARRDDEGGYVPLNEQSTALWSIPLIAEAESCLQRAFEMRRPGRFQLEAAIQSAHVHRRLYGHDNWEAIVTLYDGLVLHSPTVGAAISRIAALASARGSEAGLAALAAESSAAMQNYQPYWALKAHLLASRQQFEEARTSYATAIKLATDEVTRHWLITQQCRLPDDSARGSA